MSAPKIITELQQAGISFSIVDNKLRFTPQKRLTAELVENIKENKTEIVNYLKEDQENFVIKVHSEVLGKGIYFVSNKGKKDQIESEGLATYLPHEIKHLIRIKPNQEQLKKINLIKETFPGSEIV